MIESQTEIAMIIGLPIVLADVHLAPSATEQSVVRINNFMLSSHNQSINLNIPNEKEEIFLNRSIRLFICTIYRFINALTNRYNVF